MTIPQLVLSVIDPGALAQPANISQIPIFAGVCESGTDYNVYTFSRAEDAAATLGAGHLCDVVASALQFAASVKCVKLPIADAGEFASVSTDEALTVTSYAGTPLQFLNGRLVVTVGAALISSGNVKARLTLDNFAVPNVNAAYTDEFAIASTGIVTLPGTGGLEIHLNTAQTPAVGDDLNFFTTPGHYSSAGIEALLATLIAPAAGEYTCVAFTGDAASAAAANTCAGGVISLFQSLYARGRFVPMLCGAGIATEQEIETAFANTTCDPPFVSAGANFAFWQSAQATPSRNLLGLREHDAAAIVITGLAVSTDPGRAGNGPIVPIKGTDYDAAIKGPGLHDARIGTLRSWAPESQGYFITRQRLLSKSDSNFISWQFAAVMAVALRAAQRAMFRFELESLRRTATSTLDPRDAADVKSACENEIDQDLMIPENVRGTKGHISDRKVTVSLTTQLPALSVAVSIRPLGYPSDIRVTLEYGNA